MDPVISFEEEKIVAVMGGSIDNAGNFSENVHLCTIVAVGEEDLLLKSLRGTFRDEEVYKVSKELCVPVLIPKEKLTEFRPIDPRLGDLVLSYEKKKWSDKSFTRLVGILCEISYMAGTPKTAKILCNGEFLSVGYDSLLVLQKKS